MTGFLDLPVELLPLILQHIIRPAHIATLCLVNKYFQTFATPQLYQRAFIYAWHTEAKTKVIQLFNTLAEHPHLAKHVRQLVIRDFPKSFQFAENRRFQEICVRGITNCVNLRSCTWTRDGSLTTDILEALKASHNLQELEINGHHEGHYEPHILVDFDRLQRISLIMPSGPVIDILPRWTLHCASTLRHLSLICKTSPLVTDALLEDIAPHLVHLEHLYIVGCPKVTHRGVLAVMIANPSGLIGLGVEAVSSAFDLTELDSQARRHGALSRLRSITLTLYVNVNLTTWETQVLALLSTSPLEQFHISTAGGVGPALSDAFCANLVSTHGARLTRFSVQRMRMSLQAIELVCRSCPELQQLFVVVEQRSLEELGSCLAYAPKLRAVHINRPLDLTISEYPVIVPQEKLLSIVKQCGSHLTQFGYNTRVWQIERVMERTRDGNVVADLRLSSYESPEVPEQFLVVRT